MLFLTFTYASNYFPRMLIPHVIVMPIAPLLKMLLRKSLRFPHATSTVLSKLPKTPLTLLLFSSTHVNTTAVLAAKIALSIH